MSHITRPIIWKDTTVLVVCDPHDNGLLPDIEAELRCAGSRRTGNVALARCGLLLVSAHSLVSEECERTMRDLLAAEIPIATLHVDHSLAPIVTYNYVNATGASVSVRLVDLMSLNSHKQPLSALSKHERLSTLRRAFETRAER